VAVVVMFSRVEHNKTTPTGRFPYRISPTRLPKIYYYLNSDHSI